MNYQSFIDGKKNYLRAPAGYGKTYTIAQCIKLAKSRQLVLTHTHAGIASIKEKLKKENVPSENYSVTTITGFAQRYTLAFYSGDNLPDQSKDAKKYFSAVIREATAILKSKLVKEVIKNSYSGLFVDEYQDCTKSQHNLIMALADILPTHILGDPLQGIYDFDRDDPIVDMEEALTDASFEVFPELSTPQRWRQDGGNSFLGETIKNIRSNLETGSDIVLSREENKKYFVYTAQNTEHSLDQNCKTKLIEYIKNSYEEPDYESLLIILPEYKEKSNPRGGIYDRKQIINQTDFSEQLSLLDAIDSKSFYSIAKNIDNLINSISSARNPTKKMQGFLEKLFLKSGKKGTSNWFSLVDGKDVFTNKQDQSEKRSSQLFQAKAQNFLSNPTHHNCFKMLTSAREDLKLSPKRKDLLQTVMKVLKISIHSGLSVFEEMKDYKNRLRRSGRRIVGKCIGSTLLTKGLEFDTVVILNAEKFYDPKNFYVAVSRCRKRLIIFSNTTTLRPYSEANND